MASGNAFWESVFVIYFVWGTQYAFVQFCTCTLLYIYIWYTYIITNCTYIYLYICAIIVCKEIVLKKAALRIGCPAILWIFYSAGILLNLDFAMRMTQRHWSLAEGHWGFENDARDSRQTIRACRGKDSKRFDLIARSREKQKQEARFETKNITNEGCKAFRPCGGCFCKYEVRCFYATVPK